MTAEKTSQIRWVLIFWLFVLSAVAYLDRVNISIAGTLLKSEFHLSNIQLGRIFSSLLAGYALFQTPGGRLADKLGARRILALAVLWWGLFSALIVVVPSGFKSALLAFMSLRFLLGAGEAVMYPASNQFVARWIPSSERGLANGLIFAGVGVGAGFTPPLVTYIMLRYGWRASFVVCAVIGLLVGFVWYLIARNSPEEHSLVSAGELAKIKAGLAGSRPTEIPKLVSWGRMLRSKEVLAVTISYFTYGYVAWIFFNWFYIYLLDARGLNLKASALYSMLPFIAMAVCSLLGGLLSDTLAKSKGPRVGRCFVAVFGMALAAVFLVIGSRAGTTSPIVCMESGPTMGIERSTSVRPSVAARRAGITLAQRPVRTCE